MPLIRLTARSVRGLTGRPVGRALKSSFACWLGISNGKCASDWLPGYYLIRMARPENLRRPSSFFIESPVKGIDGKTGATVQNFPSLLQFFVAFAQVWDPTKNQ